MRLISILTAIWVIALIYTSYKIMAVDEAVVCLDILKSQNPDGFCLPKEVDFYGLLGFNFLIGTSLIFFRTYALAYRRLKKITAYTKLKVALGIFWVLLILGNVFVWTSIL